MLSEIELGRGVGLLTTGFNSSAAASPATLRRAVSDMIDFYKQDGYKRVFLDSKLRMIS
jgi:hypothetical protein